MIKMMNRFLIFICIFLAGIAGWSIISLHFSQLELQKIQTEVKYEERIQNLERFASAVTNIINNGANTQNMQKAP